MASDWFTRIYRSILAEEIGHFRNVRGLGKSMVVFRLFEKLRYSNERSTNFEEENGMYGLSRQATKL